jgi:hypothetical protein
MKYYKPQLFAILFLIVLPACSVFGDVSVKIAPYSLISKDGVFEIRQYEHLLLASTATPHGVDNASTPFYKLFGYISGKNDKMEKIAMTAPVFMNQAGEGTEEMSFVFPADFSLAMAPNPIDPTVKLEEIKNYRVAVISFSGFLNQASISYHQKLLQNWMAERDLTTTGAARAAGYNPPFTLPFLRRNEIFISVGKNLNKSME